MTGRLSIGRRPHPRWAREVTDTLTTAGVTRAATALTALSSATSEETLLSSIGAAASNCGAASGVG